MKRNLILALTLTIFGGIGLGFWQFFQFNDGRLHLTFCDVGQGDAAYLRTSDGQEVLVDGGPDDKVLDCLSSHRPFYDDKIEVLILTHPQVDHMAGLISVLQRYKVDYLVTENIFNSSAAFARFRQLVARKEIKLYNPKAGDRIRLGETEINFYWPSKVLGEQTLWSKNFQSGDLQSFPQTSTSSEMVGDFNENSLVFDIRYKDFVVLQTGDAESQILEEAISSPLSAAVLKVPHHGSKKALSQKILEFLRPKLAVISVGKNNHFGHPAELTLKILEDFQVKTLRTDKDGEIEIISDGLSWGIK